MNVRTITRRDHHALLAFLNRQPDAHYHLDWHPVEQWLQDPDTLTLIACDGESVVGGMAFTPPLGRTSWLRMLALPYENHDENRAKNRAEIFKEMWHFAQGILSGRLAVAASMIHRQWVADVLAEAGFLQTDSVINLARMHQPVPRLPLAPVKIRGPRRWENGAVLRVDHAAFSPLWQMRAYDLREAGRRANHYTVAQDGGKMVGYQLSIRYGRSLHLARLAILPECQNQGVGRTLIHDLLNHAEANGIEQVTVNTQQSNLSSQRLYERMGFLPDGSSLPVYIWNFSDDAPENP